jgi:hypothetical protein
MLRLQLLMLLVLHHRKGGAAVGSSSSSGHEDHWQPVAKLCGRHPLLLLLVQLPLMQELLLFQLVLLLLLLEHGSYVVLPTILRLPLLLLSLVPLLLSCHRPLASAFSCHPGHCCFLIVCSMLRLASNAVSIAWLDCPLPADSFFPSQGVDGQEEAVGKAGGPAGSPNSCLAASGSASHRYCASRRLCFCLFLLLLLLGLRVLLRLVPLCCSWPRCCHCRRRCCASLGGRPRTLLILWLISLVLCSRAHPSSECIFKLVGARQSCKA